MLGIPNRIIEVDFASDIVFKGVSIYGVVGRRIYQTWNQVKELLDKNLFASGKNHHAYVSVIGNKPGGGSYGKRELRENTFITRGGIMDKLTYFHESRGVKRRRRLSRPAGELRSLRQCH